MTIQRAALFGALVLVSEAAAAHGGGLNAEGCHHDRRNGDYHCHRGAQPPSTNAFAPNQRLAADQDAAVYFANCSAARAAGAAPVRRGDPGYARHLDRDGDGVGCE
jgi:hypothetical protein